VKRGVLVGLAAAALALLLLWLQGLAPVEAVRLLARGSFGSAAAWVATLRIAAPLALASLGVLVAFRCGLWNIGAEGQLIAGALAAAAAGGACGHWAAALLAGALGGFAWAWMPALLAVRRGVPEVLATLMLNGVALELLRWLVTGPLQEPTGQFPQTAPLPAGARLPRLELTRTGGIDVGLLLALVLPLVVAFAFARTTIGLKLRAGAQSPRLVEATGWPLQRARALAFGIGGALAGLAGAVEVTGVVGVVDRSLSRGLGYAAVAAALLAGLRPAFVFPAALLFAALSTGTSSLQWAPDLPGIDRFALVVQGIVILALLAALALLARERTEESDVTAASAKPGASS
jgi:simple sugar transport system permease protein